MSRLIDADRLKAYWQPDHDRTFVADYFIHSIDAQPSAEPQIVRCKDCKHYKFSDNRAFGFPVKRCEWTGFEDVDDDDFCSRAEEYTMEMFMYGQDMGNPEDGSL